MDKEERFSWIIFFLIILIPHSVIIASVFIFINDVCHNPLGIQSLKDLLEAVYYIATITGVVYAVKAYNHWMKPALFDLKIKEQTAIIIKCRELETLIKNEIHFLSFSFSIAEKDSTPGQLKQTYKSIEEKQALEERSLSYLRRKAHDVQYAKYVDTLDTPPIILENLRRNGRTTKNYFVEISGLLWDIHQNLEDRINEAEKPNVCKRRRTYNQEKITKTISDSETIIKESNATIQLIKNDRDVH